MKSFETCTFFLKSFVRWNYCEKNYVNTTEDVYKYSYLVIFHTPLHYIYIYFIVRSGIILISFGILFFCIDIHYTQLKQRVLIWYTCTLCQNKKPIFCLNTFTRIFFSHLFLRNDFFLFIFGSLFENRFEPFHWWCSR